MLGSRLRVLPRGLLLEQQVRARIRLQHGAPHLLDHLLRHHYHRCRGLCRHAKEKKSPPGGYPQLGRGRASESPYAGQAGSDHPACYPTGARGCPVATAPPRRDAAATNVSTEPGHVVVETYDGQLDAAPDAIANDDAVAATDDGHATTTAPHDEQPAHDGWSADDGASTTDGDGSAHAAETDASRPANEQRTYSYRP